MWMSQLPVLQKEGPTALAVASRMVGPCCMVVRPVRNRREFPNGTEPGIPGNRGRQRTRLPAARVARLAGAEAAAPNGGASGATGESLWRFVPVESGIGVHRVGDVTLQVGTRWLAQWLGGPSEGCFFFFFLELFAHVSCICICIVGGLPGVIGCKGDVG